MNAEDRGVIRNVLVLQNVDAPAFHIIFSHLGHGSRRSYAADEQQRRQNHSGFHRDRQIGKHSQRKCHQPDADVGPGELQQLRNLAPLAHVVSDDHQDRGQCRHRHIADQRRGKQQNTKQRERVNHPGNRRLRSGADVGGSPCDRARGRQSAEHRRENVGYSLSNELNVGIVPVVAHPIRDHSRHQRFDRAQHGYGKSRSEQPMDQIGAEVGNLPVRQAARNSAEFCPDRCHRQLKEIDGTGRKQQRNNRSRDARRERPAEQQGEQGKYGERSRLQRQCVKVAGQCLHPQPEDSGNFLEMQSEKILDLGAGDEHRNPIGESDYDRPRDEFHSGAQSRNAHDYEQYASHHRAHEQPVHTVDGDNARDDNHKCASRPPDLRLRATQSRNQKPSDDRAINSSLWRQTGSNGKCHCQR